MVRSKPPKRNKTQVDPKKVNNPSMDRSPRNADDSERDRVSPEADDPTIVDFVHPDPPVSGKTGSSERLPPPPPMGGGKSRMRLVLLGVGLALILVGYRIYTNNADRQEEAKQEQVRIAYEEKLRQDRVEQAHIAA